MHLKIQSGEEIPDGRIKMVLPGSEIPEWFGDKGIGSSLTIQLPSNCHQLKGIAFCLVFLFPLPFHNDRRFDALIHCDYHVKSKNDEHDGDYEVVFASQERHAPSYSLKTCDSDHMILLYELQLVNHLRKHAGNEVTFEFCQGCGRHETGRPVEFKSCGVYLHFDENLPVDTDLP
ncbi:hypothetical protein D5086_033805 [Populus alba]|uniref:Uncharacterized protein n=1 Tax=Populus alba TaxID=43335 RepID=A0ACC4AIG9_POPAL